MKRNEIKNVNLMAALTIGITAMMSLSTPVTAYAADPNDPDATIEPTPTEPETEMVVTEEAVHVEPVTEEIQQQAEVVQEAATEGEESAIAEAAEAAETILQGNEEEGIQAATPGEAGTIADRAIDNLIEAAKDIVIDDKDEEGNITDASAITHLEQASEAIDSVKADLQAAETNNYNAEISAETMEEEAQSAFENAVEANKVSDDMAKDVEETQAEADRLVDAIKSAETEEAAQAAYDELTQ